MNPTAHRDPRAVITFLLLLVGYFSLHIVLRVGLSGSLDLDEAEQVMLSQWLLPGYTEQPPLYTWMQYGLFQIFGRTVFAVSLLKNLLLLFTYIFVFLAARLTLHNDRTAVLAAISLLLIPQIGWESQRDMTHTTLVVCAAAATVWQVLMLLRDQHPFRYILLGLTIGVGILAKSNYLLFLAVFLIATATVAEGRKALFTPKVLLLPIVALIFASPYLIWLADNWSVLFTTAKKFKQGRDFFYLLGPLSLIRAAFLFLAPLLLLFLAVHPKAIIPRAGNDRPQEQRLIIQYFKLLFPALLMIVLLLKVTYVKDRWLQPLLFPIPLLLFSLVPAAELAAKRGQRIFFTVAGIAALAIYLAFTLRVAGAGKMDRYCRLNIPFAAMAADLAQLGFQNGVIFSENLLMAGNFSLNLPQSTALIPEYGFGRYASPGTKAAIVWLADKRTAPPEKLTHYFQTRYGIDLNTAQISSFEHPKLYGPRSLSRLAVILTDLPQSPATD